MTAKSRSYRPRMEALEGRRLLAGLIDGGQVIYHEDFESGPGGYVANNTGGQLPGLWHYSTGRSLDGLPGHSAGHNWYYGDLEDEFGGGEYATYDTHRGTLTSPTIQLGEGCETELSFNYFLQTRPPLNLDFIEVYALSNGGRTRLLSRQTGELVQGTGVWQSATADLTAFTGQPIQLQFVFDTGPAIAIDPEGWYVDDIRIVQSHVVDLGITKTADDNTPNVGQVIKYTLTASNADDDATATATNVTVTDVLPPGVILQDGVPSEGIFDPITLVWSGLELAPGETQTLELRVLVDSAIPGAVLVNSASIMGDQCDDNSANDSVTHTSIVNSVDMSVVKTAEPARVSAGDRVTYQILVTNSEFSNATATGVSVTDRLADGLTFVSSSGTFDPITRIITWDAALIGDLPIGDSVSLDVIADVDAGITRDTLTNTARVEASETDPDPSNNSSTVTIPVDREPAAQGVQFIAPLSVFRSDQLLPPVAARTTVLGFVWHDINGDGVRDANEPGVSGADVRFSLQTDPSTSEFVFFVAEQTRDVDLNNDGSIDPLTETGVYFIARDVLPDGLYNLTISIPGDLGGTFPADGTGQPLRVFNADPSPPETPPELNFGVQTDFVRSPPSGTGTVIGYLWADLNQNGVRDAGEPARTDAQVFVNVRGDGIFDPENGDRSVQTDDAGRYILANLPSGEYLIGELDTLANESGTTLIATSPAIDNDPAGRFYRVNVADGEVIEGNSEAAGPLNFGSMVVGNYVRPADRFEEIWARASNVYPALLDALLPSQSFVVRNDSAEDFAITGQEISLFKRDANDRNMLVPDPAAIPFLSLRQVIRTDGVASLQTPSFPMTVDANSLAEFILFYDPAIRDGDGAVISQMPDWLPATRNRDVHTFEAGSEFALVTDRNVRHRVNLFGGSTFDSDIGYDGLVGQDDFTILDTLLANEPVIRFDNAPRLFDPTMDVNARCPNGADQIAATCRFPSDGVPRRELGLGDFGPINAEVGDIRDPIAIQIDLPRMPAALLPAASRAAVVVETEMPASVAPLSIAAESTTDLWTHDEEACFLKPESSADEIRAALPRDVAPDLPPPSDDDEDDAAAWAIAVDEALPMLMVLREG